MKNGEEKAQSKHKDAPHSFTTQKIFFHKKKAPAEAINGLGLRPKLLNVA